MSDYDVISEGLAIKAAEYQALQGEVDAFVDGVERVFKEASVSDERACQLWGAMVNTIFPAAEKQAAGGMTSDTTHAMPMPTPATPPPAAAPQQQSLGGVWDRFKGTNWKDPRLWGSMAATGLMGGLGGMLVNSLRDRRDRGGFMKSFLLPALMGAVAYPTYQAAKPYMSQQFERARTALAPPSPSTPGATT
jgi:hypothetical protein